MEVLKALKKFYMDMQQDEAKLKRKIKDSKGKERAYQILVFAVRPAVIVAFAVLFITVISSLFGSDNSSLAIVMLVTLMTLRFVHFSYNITETLLTFAVIMLIYLFVPNLALIAPTWSVFFIHFIAMMLLLMVATQRPEMGMGGLFGFSYSYLIGNAVEGTNLGMRAGAALFCYIIIAAILVYKHRKKDREVHFFSLASKNFDFHNPQNLWRIRLALGVAIALTLGRALGIPRYMWLAFACSSILAKYPPSVERTGERLFQRIEGAAIGSSLFCILCNLIPSEMYSMIGLLSGYFLGFCSEYRSKTVVIAFGALSIAVEIYGVVDATLLRVINNVLGALLALTFAFLFDRIVTRHLVPKKQTA